MVGRELRRVPLDFEYPSELVWYGKYLNVKTCHGEKHCEKCRKFAQVKGIPMEDYGCPDYEGYFEEVNELLKKLCEPPVGEGYQLWETTTEGSPVSPVFETLEELCIWCEVNATVYGDEKASKEQWMELLS